MVLGNQPLVEVAVEDCFGYLYVWFVFNVCNYGVVAGLEVFVGAWFGDASFTFLVLGYEDIVYLGFAVVFVSRD